MANATEYVWNPNSVDTSCLSMDKNKIYKKNFWIHYRWPILIFIFIFISTIVLTTIFVIRAKRNSQPSVIHASNTSAKNQTYNISIKGLYTIETAAEANICDNSHTIEDCVLIYNAKIMMSVLLLVSSPTSNASLKSSTAPEKSTKSTTDCKSLRIRRSQLSQILDPNTLRTVFDLSGVPYTPDDDATVSDASDQGLLRTQIDARSIQSKWTSPINYYISTTTGLTPSIIANIHTAVSNWENNTCLKFNELSVITSTTNKSYVSFQRDDQYGCSSPVGYDKTDPTSVILISLTCGGIIGSIMHEIGHTLGYIHTQSRVDRNSYVTIVTQNIQPNYIANFLMWPYGTIRFLDVTFPYDFGSLMHYDPYGFTINNQPTIIPLDTRYERTMGQRERAAFHDYKQMNRLYFSRDACPQMFTNNNCLNSGYLDPKTCSHCVCPEGFSGTYCDQRDSNSNCGDTIINSTPYSPTQIVIQNPSPTSITPMKQHCVYLIQSLSPGKIRLRLDSINTLRVTTCSLSSLVEVKYKSDLGLAGARWCGSTITSVWSNVTAETNTMVVMFRASNYINITNGNQQASFRATIFFDAEPTSAANLTISTTTTTTTMSTTTTTVSSTTSTTTVLTTTGTTSSACPPSSFRCQLPSQPTCGGCLNYQPCTTQGTELCTAYNIQIQVTNCNQIINGVAQCQYQFVETPYITTCSHTILLCCPSYQLIAYQSNYYCVYNPQATNLPSEWSLIL